MTIPHYLYSALLGAPEGMSCVLPLQSMYEVEQEEPSLPYSFNDSRILACCLKYPLRSPHCRSLQYPNNRYTTASTRSAETGIFCDHIEPFPFPTSRRLLVSPHVGNNATSSGTLLSVRRTYRILDLCTDSWCLADRNLD